MITATPPGPRTSFAVGLAAAFEERVLVSPGATAVIAGDHRLTYGELNFAANTIAADLRALGLGRGSFIGLGFERSPELLAALWGVVKSGAAYIPVDPAYPDERVGHMAASARWSAFLTSDVLQQRFASIPGLGQTLKVDLAATREEPDPAPAARPEDPLYAIFTSGSTGAPKAAVVNHGGFSNLLAWYIETFALDTTARVLVPGSPSFDLTQKNFLAPLLAGGTIILLPPGPFDLALLEHEITTHGVTLINTTPSAFYPLVDAAAPRAFTPLATLRAAVLGGEPIAVSRLRAWLSAPLTRAFVANTYGPTECTDISTWDCLDVSNLDARDDVPLGHPLPGVGILLLDENLRPVPEGELGELCITGAGVGEGYLHDPARTADRFIPNPWPDLASGPKLYRTGDLARRSPDGTLEFRGRRDHQVKVRGFRIELGEIESALASHPGIREAVITATSMGTESARLDAWIVRDGAASDETDWRAHLAAALPAHMMPDAFHVLEAFPLTPNGKINRLALEARAGEIPAASNARALGGGDDWESRLLALWSEVLGRPILDPTASFFDLGGNSIHLAVMHARLRGILEMDLPITDLFIHPSPRSLARHLGGKSTDAARSTIVDRARRQQAGFARLRRPNQP